MTDQPMPITESVTQRARVLFTEHRQQVFKQTDRFFAALMLCQWMAGIALALSVSPRAWAGQSSQTHLHVWAAIGLGGAISVFPIALALVRPGENATRHVIATAQMLTSALLIHLTGGRIETHFHVFGSLAFLMFYRDWKVLVSATVVIAADHCIRGIFWPLSVFGVLTASPWRWLEHAFWVLFEDAFLIPACWQGAKEMRQIAERQATLEALNAQIEDQVQARTAELKASEARFRAMNDSSPLGIYVTDSEGNCLYTNPLCREIAGLSLEEAVEDRWGEAIHPEDRARVLAEWSDFVGTEGHFTSTYRFCHKNGGIIWANSKAAAIREASSLLGYIGTIEDITQRKKAESELEAAHKQLMEGSRQAGMSEVATAVLHNVGNVLNSVNVSASLVIDTIRESKLPGLSKAVGLMSEQTDLGQFLSSDPKGRQLPDYLRRLGDHLSSEQGLMLNELGLLFKNIEHIKDIVSMQQAYARVSGVAECVFPADLAEDALRMNAASLARHDVQVVREYGNLPKVLVEKHKVLQVLVNLIGNAKHAMDDGNPPVKRLTMRIGMNGNNHFKIAVTDNGIGVPAENLTRIFAHGFTTKKTGHGFGLHSGALAAKEMGGALHVHSDGLGKGATFTLELPLKREEGNG
jgi:PAS domain S-box-containing protein